MIDNLPLNQIKFKELRLPQPDKINPERLDEELREALGNKYLSLDTGVEVVVRAVDHASQEDADMVEKIVQQHDPKKLSKAEQKRADRAAAKERLKALDTSKKLSLEELTQAFADLREIVLHDG